MNYKTLPDTTTRKTPMGIPLDIFSLYQLQGEGEKCNHYLLVKVEQSAYSNANQNEYDYATYIADQKKNCLIEIYKAEILFCECNETHLVSLVGELQGHPVGNELIQENEGRDVDLWIAETRFGYPWVVLGTAESEDSFWYEIEQNEDLSSLGASRPARQQRVFFLIPDSEDGLL